MRRSVIGLCVVVFIGFVLHAWGWDSPQMSSNIITESDAIYSARAVGVGHPDDTIARTNAATFEQLFVFRCKVDGVIKGPTNDIVDVEVFGSTNLSYGGRGHPPPFVSLMNNRRVLLFLVSAGARLNRYRLLDDQKSLFYLPDQGCGAFIDTGQPQDRLRCVVVHALRSGQGSMAYHAIRALRRIGLSDDAVAALRDLVMQKDSPDRIDALALLLRNNDVFALQQSKTFFHEGLCDELGSNELAMAIISIRDRRCLKTLEDLRRSETGLLRESADQALQNIYKQNK